MIGNVYFMYSYCFTTNFNQKLKNQIKNSRETKYNSNIEGLLLFIISMMNRMKLNTNRKWIYMKIWGRKFVNNNKKYLHATSMVADWLLAFPRPDHAWHSHLNADLPKYSNTKSFDMVAVISNNWTPVRGSTWESDVDGGGCELPLHLKNSCCGNWREWNKNKTQKEINKYMYCEIFSVGGWK